MGSHRPKKFGATTGDQTSVSRIPGELHTTRPPRQLSAVTLSFDFLPTAYVVREEVIFSVCLSVHTWGGVPHPADGGGVPHPRSSRGGYPIQPGGTPSSRGGYPIQLTGGGTPSSRPEGYPIQPGGYPVLPAGGYPPGRGTPSHQGYPPPH